MRSLGATHSFFVLGRARFLADHYEACADASPGEIGERKEFNSLRVDPTKLRLGPTAAGLSERQ